MRYTSNEIHINEERVLFRRMNLPSRTQRPEDAPLWSYFGRDAPEHNRTKIGRIRPLIYFGSAMSDLHLASRNIEKFPENPRASEFYKGYGNKDKCSEE